MTEDKYPDNISLNLCDVGDQLFQLGRVDSLIDLIHPKGFMVGSYFCDSYFILETMSLLEKLASYEKEITCVLPICSQTNREDFWKVYHNIRSEYAGTISRWVANDIGILEWLMGKGEKVVLGRLFHKRIRDPRYYETIQTHKYELDIETARLLGEYEIDGIEVENTYDNFCLDERSYDIYVHLNYEYMSCMRRCFYSSVSQATDHKFRPDNPCNQKCKKNIHRIMLQTDEEVFLIGKGMYFKLNNPMSDVGAYVKGYIYTPIDELLGGQ